MPSCYQCPGRSFNDDNALRMHRESKHSGYTCDECGNLFRSRDALEQHTTNKHSLFECEYCDREFSTDQGRLAHQEAKHHPMFECDHCDREFTTDEGRLAHQKAKHSMFECRYCDSEFKTAHGRDAHEDAKHSTFECRYCEREFNSEEAREQHEEAKHGGFECFHCNRKFSSTAARQQHQDSKHRTFTHALSDQHFSGVEANQWKGEGSSWTCKYCAATFFTQYSKTTHEASCRSNPANRVEESNSRPSPDPSIADDDSEASSSSCVVRQSDGESVSVASPSPSDSSLAEVEMFHSTSGFPPTDASGEPPHLCPHLLDPRVCSTCPQSSNADKSVQDDIAIAPTDANITVLDVLFCCTLCMGYFETEATFQSHPCPVVPALLRPHCQICYSQFDNGSLLQQHLEDLQTFSCQLCLTRCCSDEMLQDHLLSHPTCSKCGKSFANNLSLCAHVESDHPAVVCWDCDGIVVENNSLELHYAESPAHPSCAICGLGKRTLAEMDEHVHDAHAASAEIEGPLETDNQANLHADSLSAEVQTLGVNRQDTKLDHMSPSMEEITSPAQLPDDVHNSPLQTVSSLTLLSQIPLPADVEQVDEAASGVPGKEPLDAGLPQYASPSPTPSEQGSDLSQTQSHASRTTYTTIQNDTRPLSPASTVSAEAFSDLSTQSSATSSSQSVVFVTADGIPDYIRENRAILVATSTGPPSSGHTPLRVVSWSSLESELLGRTNEGRAPVSDSIVPPPPPTCGVTHRLHCRICSRDPCEEMTATICGHLFCKRCITQAVVAKSECPVCKSATLLYCLFKLDLSI